MPLRANKTAARASISCEMQEAAGAFAAGVKKPGLTVARLLPAGAYDEVFLGSWVVPAGGTQQVDLRSFTNVFSGVLATKVVALVVRGRASAAGARLRLRPGQTNGLLWGFGALTDSFTLQVPSDGSDCGILILDGTHAAVSDTSRNLELAATGSADVTAAALAVVGT